CNSDYLYVLSTFIYEPIRWIDRFGWRGLTGNERLASYYFWCAVGRRVGIREIPESYEIAKLGPPNMDDQSHFPRATNGSQ
ncbi:MAG: oxygenase MpaB family protein, partial [Terrimicrobiaceae bacterium]